MKQRPDIAPEIRGLLEEIAADPRSAMRLVPRKPLRTWFERGESAGASAIATTRAERHLVEEHRESLAALLCEAAWLAYWKAPVLAHRPVGQDGQPYHPAEREPQWRRRASRLATDESQDGAQLLRDCLEGVRADHAHDLAVASLSLVPCDRTRCYAALTLPWDRPRSAARFFHRLALMAWPVTLRPQALLSLGARLSATERFEDARQAYLAHAELEPSSPYGWIGSLVLSSVLGERSGALRAAEALAHVTGPHDRRLAEERDLIREWASRLSVARREMARQLHSELHRELPEAAWIILEALDT